MADRSGSTRRLAGARRLVPHLLALVLLACTLAVWWFWSETAARRGRDHFETQVRRITRALTTRLDGYASLLESGAALFAASESVSSREWRDFYEYRQTQESFPGLKHVVYAPVIPRDQISAHETVVRRSGLPDYAVWPVQQSAWAAPVLYIEPQDEGGLRALGFDLASEPVRRAALQKARATGRATLSGRVGLVSQIEPGEMPGCILFVPIFHKAGLVPGQPRGQAGLRGFVFAPFQIQDFLGSLHLEGAGEVGFQIYDGLVVSPATRMSNGPASALQGRGGEAPLFRQIETLDFFGHPWTLVFESTPSFDSGVDRWTARGILVAGLLISTLSFFFLRNLEQTQARATALARGMTSALREKTAALQESERKLRAITDSAQDAIVVLDTRGRVAYWNPAAERIFGYPRQEILGEEVIPRVAAASSRPGLIRELRKLVRIGASQASGRTVELTARKKGGEEFPAEVSVSAIPVGEGWHVVAVVRDITERRRGEEERVAREAAEEASRAKSGFVANMSHEIRTPLNAILGFTQVLERDPFLTPQQAEHVRTISRSGTHLLHLINDILDMSRIEAGRVLVRKAPFCLHDLLDDLALMFRSRAHAKGLQLLEERDRSVPRSVVADEGKLRQVFINLLGNAVKFTQEGGIAVRVRAEAGQDQPGLIRLIAEVEDSGPGISPEDLEHIFDAFGQAEAGLKAGGTGLGLAISRRFVEMMGGTLGVVSVPGKGSCFRFDVLVEPSEDLAEREKPVLRRVIGLEPGSGPWRILVVDDIATNRALLVELLRPLGFQVREAGDGAEALEAFTRWSPHAILMDMRMPVMDGYEATRRIRASESGVRTPIIAVTASAFDDLRDQVMAVGVDRYLRKPFRSDELLEALEECLGLRYVYEGVHSSHLPSLPEGSLAALPQDLLLAMRQAVVEGDMGRLAELLGRVADPELVGPLQALADRYEYERLLELLGRMEGGS
jgi:PAS domain S-box-containing protein